MPENPKPGMDCESGLVKGDPKKTDNFKAEKKFAGVKGKRYKVSLRFRGVVEPMMYKNGKKEGQGVMKWSDGGVYEGMWKDDLRSGTTFPLASSLQAGVEGKDARGMVMGRV